MKLRNRILGIFAIVIVLAVGSLAVALSYDAPCSAAAELPAGSASMNDMTQSAASAAQLKQQLADALSMMERAEVIDFNGHMSCRLPGTAHILINSGKSVRSDLSADDIIAIDLDFETVGQGGSMLMVSASGTAVTYS